VPGSTNQIPFGSRRCVAAEAITSELIDYFGGAAYSNLRTLLRYRQLKKLPVVGKLIPASFVLEHDFTWN